MVVEEFGERKPKPEIPVVSIRVNDRYHLQTRHLAIIYRQGFSFTLQVSIISRPHQLVEELWKGLKESLNLLVSFISNLDTDRTRKSHLNSSKGPILLARVISNPSADSLLEM